MRKPRGIVGVAGEGRRRVAAVAALAVAAASAHLAAPVNAYDGAISASSGTFILHGLVPYRDFWLLYGPLSGYIVAAALLVAPPTVGLLRTLGLGAVGVQAAAGYALIRDHTTPVAAALIAVLAMAAPVAFTRLDVSAWSVAMAAALAALAVAHSSHPRAPIAAGLVAGIAFVSRLDVGAYVLLALLLVHRRPATIAGFLAVTVPVAGVALMLVPLPALFEQLVWYPLVGTQTYRALSIDVSAHDPSFAAAVILVGWLPRVAIVATGLLVAFGRRPGLGALAAFALLCQLQTLGRGDLIHLAQAASPALLLTAAWFPPRPRHSFRWAVGLGVLASALAPLILISIAWLAVPTAEDEHDLNAAVARVREITGPDEPIFVGLTSNRYTFANPLLVYFLAARPPGTSSTMYVPGITNTSGRQAEMVEQLGASNTRVAVLDDVWSRTCETSNLSCAPGSTTLDEYLATTYVDRLHFGSVIVALQP